jgi:hypothetical protein
MNLFEQLVGRVIRLGPGSEFEFEQRSRHVVILSAGFQKYQPDWAIGEFRMVEATCKLVEPGPEPEFHGGHELDEVFYLDAIKYYVVEYIIQARDWSDSCNVGRKAKDTGEKVYGYRAMIATLQWSGMKW